MALLQRAVQSSLAVAVDLQEARPCGHQRLHELELAALRGNVQQRLPFGLAARVRTGLPPADTSEREAERDKGRKAKRGSVTARWEFPTAMRA